METTETESPSPVVTPLPSLEHLLMSPDPKQGVLEGRRAPCNSYSVYESSMCRASPVSKVKTRPSKIMLLLICLPFLFGSSNGNSEEARIKPHYTQLTYLFLSQQESRHFLKKVYLFLTVTQCHQDMIP